MCSLSTQNDVLLAALSVLFSIPTAVLCFAAGLWSLLPSSIIPPHLHSAQQHTAGIAHYASGQGHTVLQALLLSSLLQGAWMKHMVVETGLLALVTLDSGYLAAAPGMKGSASAGTCCSTHFLESSDLEGQISYSPWILRKLSFLVKFLDSRPPSV